jgi:hypothetical protein
LRILTLWPLPGSVPPGWRRNPGLATRGAGGGVECPRVASRPVPRVVTVAWTFHGGGH